MARCAHCTQKLPKRAVVCPYCGYPVPPNTQDNANAPGNLTPILAGGIAGLVLVSDGADNADTALTASLLSLAAAALGVPRVWMHRFLGEGSVSAQAVEACVPRSSSTSRAEPPRSRKRVKTSGRWATTRAKTIARTGSRGTEPSAGRTRSGASSHTTPSLIGSSATFFPGR